MLLMWNIYQNGNQTKLDFYFIFVIKLLLVIGGVEQNPGPKCGEQKENLSEVSTNIEILHGDEKILVEEMKKQLKISKLEITELKESSSRKYSECQMLQRKVEELQVQVNVLKEQLIRKDEHISMLCDELEQVEECRDQVTIENIKNKSDNERLHSQLDGLLLKTSLMTKCENMHRLISSPIILGLKEAAQNACRNRDWGYCITLLQQSLEYNSVPYSQLQDLDCDMLLTKAAERGHTSLIAVFVKNGFPVNNTCDFKRGGTMLHFAAYNDQQDTMEFLISVNCNINVRDSFSETPLMWALKGRSGVQSIEYLLSSGADPNAQGEDKFTPLHYAARIGNLEFLGLLLNYGAYVNARDALSWTPLHFAANGGHVDTLYMLLNEGAETSCQTSHGETAQHIAAANGCSIIVEVLHDHSCNCMILDSRGLTSLRCAQMNNHVHVIDILERCPYNNHHQF